MKFGGYAGKILDVDLSKGKFNSRSVEEKFAEKYLGGAGFCARILYDEIGPETRPLSPSNVLVIATGPLTGTLFPQCSRHVIAAKSPLTGIWGEAHAAGHWGAELKFAGYDLIVIRKRAENPVYLYIDDEDVKLRDASDLWGRDVCETHEMIKDGIGREFKQLYIGQAGENKVRFAAVMNDIDRVAARSGLGAVMGSKNLKAVAVRGSHDIPISAEKEEYIEMVESFHEKMLSDPGTQERAKYGTWILTDLMNEIGRLPTRNFQTGVFDDVEGICAERLRKKYLVKKRADFACLQRCGRYSSVRKGPYAYIGGGPEFESLCNLGSKCGTSDTEPLLYLLHLCNRYGIGTCSCSGVIAWAIECYEKGILKKEEVGFELKWGNVDAQIELVKKIANREGFGDVLAEGSYRAARKIGRGSEKYVMTVKKQEVPAQDGRAQKSMGLANATAARGADHLYGFPTLDEAIHEDAIKERYGEEYMPEIADRLNPKYKGIMIRENEDFAIVVESLGVCKYGTMVPPAFYYCDLAEALRFTVGMDVNEQDLRKIGDRLVNLNRMFNVREGITRKADTLPDRLLKVPPPEGPAKGEVVELDEMLDEYYKERDWRLEDGIPKEKKLQELGLEFTLSDLPH